MGIRPLKEVNLVSGLKLIRRILSNNSLWVNWIKTYLIRKGSIQMIKENTQNGSWMWRKVLKCREIAKTLYRVEVINGQKAYFQFETWSSLGCLQELLCGRGHIDMGIPANATMGTSRNHRRRISRSPHRVPILIRLELEIEKYKVNWIQEKDISLWRNEKGKYKKEFSTRETWLNIREKYHLCSWHPAVWFKHSTPKYAFVTWMVMHGRLTTGDRMRSWNINDDASCVLCQDPLETIF